MRRFVKLFILPYKWSQLAYSTGTCVFCSHVCFLFETWVWHLLSCEIQRMNTEHTVGRLKPVRIPPDPLPSLWVHSKALNRFLIYLAFPLSFPQFLVLRQEETEQRNRITQEWRYQIKNKMKENETSLLPPWSKVMSALMTAAPLPTVSEWACLPTDSYWFLLWIKKYIIQAQEKALSTWSIEAEVPN